MTSIGQEIMVAKIFNRMLEVAHDVFKVYVVNRKLKTMFFPMPDCFEVYGFDFMVGEDGEVSIYILCSSLNCVPVPQQQRSL